MKETKQILILLLGIICALGLIIKVVVSLFNYGIIETGKEALFYSMATIFGMIWVWAKNIKQEARG